MDFKYKTVNSQLTMYRHRIKQSVVVRLGQRSRSGTTFVWSHPGGQVGGREGQLAWMSHGACTHLADTGGAVVSDRSTAAASSPQTQLSTEVSSTLRSPPKQVDPPDQDLLIPILSVRSGSSHSDQDLLIAIHRSPGALRRVLMQQARCVSPAPVLCCPPLPGTVGSVWVWARCRCGLGVSSPSSLIYSLLPLSAFPIITRLCTPLRAALYSALSPLSASQASCGIIQLRQPQGGGTPPDDFPP